MIGRALLRVSSALVSVEKGLLSGLMAVIALTVLLNVVVRFFDITIAWADEFAVYAMILSAFVGASLMLRARIHPAVLLAHDLLPQTGIRILRGVVSLLSLAFGIALFYLCLRWFDPAALVRAGFDVSAFEGATFNFIYTDTTPVLGIRTVWFYLVMPWFALTLCVHSATNLCEDLGVIAIGDDPARLAMEDVAS